MKTQKRNRKKIPEESPNSKKWFCLLLTKCVICVGWLYI